MPSVSTPTGDGSAEHPGRGRLAVIGGLITSTLLSLVVIPAAYTVVDDLGGWFARRFGRGSAHPPQPARAVDAAG